MTNKTTMPGPVAWFEKTADRNWFLAYSFNPTSVTKPLITTDQAEAYKDACVREALEEVLKLFGDMPDKGSGLMWTVLTNQIRALIPTDNATMEQQT